MRHALSLAQEFGLDLFIHHANATRALAGELAAARIPVSFGPVLPFLGREDPALDGPVELVRLGGKVSFHQDHPDGHQYYLRDSASLFVRRGMPEDEALAALTLNPAALFHLEKKIGSLEPGKDADFVILSGPPLEVESRVEQVFVEGIEVYNRATGKNVFGRSNAGAGR
jgi:imidazolonepropionase-like amidohydrolase